MKSFLTVTGIPSITYSGSFPPIREVPPLTRMRTALPGAPSTLVTCTPAAFPARALSSVTCGTSFNSFVSIVDIAPVRSFLLVVP
ncbi:hypothetical protein D3C80_1240030 [compost metagenome]